MKGSLTIRALPGSPPPNGIRIPEERHRGTPLSLDIQKETFYNCSCSDCSVNCPRFSWDDDTHKYKLHMHTLIAVGYRWCCTEMLFFNWPPRVMTAVRSDFFFFFQFCSSKIFVTMPFVLPDELSTCLGIFRHPIT